MAREKKAKIKSMKPKKSFKERISGLLFAIISLICAGALFVGLLFLENYFAEDITYKEAVVAIADIPEGEIITEENLNTYFGLKSINMLTLSNGSLTKDEMSSLLNKKVRIPLQSGEIVAMKDFQDLNIYTDEIKNPVEISIAVDSMASSDGGKIRAGDLVNITLMFTDDQLGIEENNKNSGHVVVTKPVTSAPSDTEVLAEETSENTSENTSEESSEQQGPVSYYVDKDMNQYETTGGSSNTSKSSLSIYKFDTYSQYILENIYVSKVLASDGSVINPTDTESTAAIFIFVIPKEMELELNNALENCTSMRVSKILYKYEPEKQDLKQEEVQEDEEMEN